MDDSYVEDALTAALERFQRPRDQTVETDLETDGEESLVQLRKACRQLEAARTLRANNGYATSIIELSFAAIERSLQYYLQANGQYEPGEFQSHEAVYSAAARPAMNLFSGSLGDRFQTL